MTKHLMTFSLAVKTFIGDNITPAIDMVNISAQRCAQRIHHEGSIQSGPRNSQRWLFRAERYLSCTRNSTPVELFRSRVLDLLDVRNHIRHRH
jgi:hypothetical protein